MEKEKTSLSDKIESNLEEELFKQCWQIYKDDFPISKSFEQRLKEIIKLVREKSQEIQLEDCEKEKKKAIKRLKEKSRVASDPYLIRLIDKIFGPKLT
jgi:hypothetical protein